MYNVTFGEIPDYDGIGIYCIKNTENGKVYVGQSINVQSRLRQHVTAIRNGKCAAKFLEDAIHGAHFEFSVLEEIESPTTKGFLCDRERFWERKLNSSRTGYNGDFINPTNFPDQIVENKNDKQFTTTTETSEKIRIIKAAQKANQSIAQYILDAVRARMESENL